MFRSTLAIAVLLALPAAAQEPARNANVWDGKAHEPNPGVVHQQEQNAGIAPDQQKREQDTDTLERQAQHLLNKTKRDTGGP